MAIVLAHNLHMHCAAKESIPLPKKLLWKIKSQNYQIKLVRRVYTDLHKANQNSIKLTAIVQKESAKIKKLLDRSHPWSYWYDLSYPILLTVLFKVTGLYDQVIEISKKDNPETRLLDFLEAESETGVEDKKNQGVILDSLQSAQ